VRYTDGDGIRSSAALRFTCERLESHVDVGVLLEVRTEPSEADAESTFPARLSGGFRREHPFGEVAVRSRLIGSDRGVLTEEAMMEAAPDELDRELRIEVLFERDLHDVLCLLARDPDGIRLSEQLVSAFHHALFGSWRASPPHRHPSESWGIVEVGCRNRGIRTWIPAFARMTATYGRSHVQSVDHPTRYLLIGAIFAICTDVRLAPRRLDGSAWLHVVAGREGVRVADIDVQRKRPSFLPFLLAAVVLGLVIWGLIRLFDREEEWRIDTPIAPADTIVAPEP
jgi:hypothetical protein